VAKVVGQVQAPKVIVFRYIPKERFRRRQGHRHQYTRLEVEAIELPGGKKARAAKDEAPAATDAPKPSARRKTAGDKPAARKPAAARPAARAASKSKASK
jgi:large subunit ribosomal protein L21